MGPAVCASRVRYLIDRIPSTYALWAAANGDVAQEVNRMTDQSGNVPSYSHYANKSGALSCRRVCHVDVSLASLSWYFTEVSSCVTSFRCAHPAHTWLIGCFSSSSRLKSSRRGILYTTPVGMRLHGHRCQDRQFSARSLKDPPGAVLSALVPRSHGSTRIRR